MEYKSNVNLEISASIVLYNTDVAMLEKSIHSFVNCRLTHKLLLVDNSPTPVPVNYRKFKNVEYIHCKKNLGFGAAHNVAIDYFNGESKYHLVLNPDVTFEHDVLENLYIFLEENPAVAHVMPKVLFPDGTTQQLCRGYPSYFNIFVKRLVPGKLKWLFKRSLEAYEPSNFNYDALHENIPFLSGCFMLIRTDVLKEVGGFDNDIFLYFEDADLTQRILKKYKNVYYPKAHIVHEYQRGTKKSLKHILYAFHGLSVYIKKNRKKERYEQKNYSDWPE